MLIEKPLKILVIGCGSIGRRHIRLLKEMGVEVEGLEANIQAADKAMTELGVPVGWDLKWAVTDKFQRGKFDGAIIATPNHLHHEAAISALVDDLPVLIEKPMAHTVADAQRIALYTHIADGKVLVGYSLRFHPGLRKLKRILDEGDIGTVRHATVWCASYLPNWRPGTDYTQNYAASPETGGGVLLDCSHEIDYLLWMFGEAQTVSCTTLNSGALRIAAEEAADLIIRFKNGVQANVHLSYLDQWPFRGCRMVGDKGTACWDVSTDFVWLRNCPAQASPVAPDDFYKAELRHFLSVIQGEEKPLVTGEDGIRVLQIVEAAKQSAKEGRVVTL